MILIFFYFFYLFFFKGSRKKRDRDRDRDRERERERSVNNLTLSGFPTNILKFPKIPITVESGINGNNNGILSVPAISNDSVVRYVRAIYHFMFISLSVLNQISFFFQF